MLERLVQHGPDLAAGGWISDFHDAGFLDVGGENDGAGWICHVVVWRVGCPLTAHAAKKDVVVGGIRIEKDFGAIEGIQPAVQAIQRRATAADEADIGNACSRVRSDGEHIAARIADSAGIATQGRLRCGACLKRCQTAGEGQGQGRRQNVVVVSVFRRAWRAWRGGEVLQSGAFVECDEFIRADNRGHFLTPTDDGHTALGPLPWLRLAIAADRAA
ncbi:hypothetical protein D3C78_984430 [compost metagenome]